VWNCRPQFAFSARAEGRANRNRETSTANRRRAKNISQRMGTTFWGEKLKKNHPILSKNGMNRATRFLRGCADHTPQKARTKQVKGSPCMLNFSLVFFLAHARSWLTSRSMATGLLPTPWRRFLVLALRVLGDCHSHLFSL